MELAEGQLTIVPEGRSRFVTITIGNKENKKSIRVHYKELWSAVWVLGDKEFKDQLIPVQKTQCMLFSRQHKVRATRDIKQGDEINFWCEVSVEKTVVEAIAEKNGAKVIEKSVEVLSTPQISAPPEEAVH